MQDSQRIQQAGEYLVTRIRASMEQVAWSELIELSEMLCRVNRTFVFGAGRSGLVARSFGMRLMHAGLLVSIPGETVTPAVCSKDLVVAISCTGETGYTAYLARRAREFGAQVVVITAETQSAIAQEADKVIGVPVSEEDIVNRAAVFEHTTSLCLDALFNIVPQRMKTDAEAFRRRHANLE